MRTHIRMHFDKKTNDFNEENYISCILDEDNNGDSHPVTTPTNQPETHYCDKCSYTSSFKGNVVRAKYFFRFV